MATIAGYLSKFSLRIIFQKIIKLHFDTIYIPKRIEAYFEKSDIINKETDKQPKKVYGFKFS